MLVLKEEARKYKEGSTNQYSEDRRSSSITRTTSAAAVIHYNQS
jgi:hypothetical protein